MKHDSLGAAEPSFAPCRYGMSRQFFRGPRRSLKEAYLAFIGGTDTYGKFIEHPFPQLVETGLGWPCVNFGVVNAGVDAYLGDPAIVQYCAEAEVTVIQLMGAQNLSNRFYKVHPRRNDRFLAASTVMKALFSEVDFADFTFNRHMLSALYEKHADRFDILIAELEEAWLARMKTLINQIGSRVVLLWMADFRLSDDPWNARPDPFQGELLFITRSMVEQLRPLVLDVVETRLSTEAKEKSTDGMVFPLLADNAAYEILGPLAHEETAARLLPSLRAALVAA